jgi:auxin efflux carrier family protein
MITGANLYAVAKAMAPLYTAMALGYISVKYLRAFTPDQCAGINHFVALYALPLLIFRMVAANNPYAMSGKLLAADTLQKIILLAVLFSWAYWANKHQKKSPPSPSSSTPLQWVVTLFSLASLPNTIIMGVPLLGGMYGSISASLMAQIVVLQFCIWYNLVIFLYEYMAAKRAVLAKCRQLRPVAATVKDSTTEIAMQVKESSTEMTHPQPEVCVTIIEDAKAEMSESETSETKETAAEVSKTVVPMKASLTEPVDPPEPTIAVKVVVRMAMKRLLKIPNTHASFLGLVWSLMAFK